MNPLGAVALVLALLLAWALAGQVRAGEFTFRAGGPGMVRKVKRADNPELFWVLAAFFGGVILYIASFALPIDR